jgi:sporulation protein YlmC with PRC-barrel domain
MRTIALVLALAGAVSAAGAVAQTEPPAGSTAPGDAGVIKVDVARVALGHRATKLVGAAVVNNKDERIGTIDDLVVTPDDKVTYAVLSVGGFLGIGSKLVAVPFHALQMVKEDRLILPGATKDALKDLPEFKYAKG